MTGNSRPADGRAVPPRFIRRSSEMPAFARIEAEQNYRYAETGPIDTSADALRLFWRASRWKRLADGEGLIRSREAFGWIEDQGNRIGAIQLFGFEVPPEASDFDVVDELDSLSQADRELGELLWLNWGDIPELGKIGPIIEVRNTWVAPSHFNVGWASSIERILGSAFSDHSLLVTKAFPLEYVGIDSDPALQAGRKKRQAAMFRYYRRKMGFEIVPGEWGERGWMWRPNPKWDDIVPKPQRRSRL